MVVRRSLRQKLNSASSSPSTDTSPESFTGILSTKYLAKKRGVADAKHVSVPTAKRRRVNKTKPLNLPQQEVNDTLVNGKLCPMSEIVNAVLSDSPMSKCSSLPSDDEEPVVRDVRLVGSAKKSLFKCKENLALKPSTPKKNICEAGSDAPKSAGKFFKNRTPQKSKVFAARAKSIHTIRQTCLGQKIKNVASKDAAKKPVSKRRNTARQYAALKFVEQNVGKTDSKENIVELVDGDEEPIVMSDENSFSESVVDSVVSEASIVSGPVMNQGRYQTRSWPASVSSSSSPVISTANKKFNKKTAGFVMSKGILPSPILYDTTQTVDNAASPELNSGCPTVADDMTSRALNKRRQRLNQLIRSGSGESSPALSSKHSSRLESSAERAVSAQSAERSTQKSSESRIAAILSDFMLDEEEVMQEVKHTTRAEDKEEKEEVSDSNVNKVSENEAVYYPVFTNSPKLAVSQCSSLHSSPSLLVKAAKLLADKRVEGLEQTALDFGQRDLGTTQCKVCGMVYNQKDPDDEQSHVKFHQRLLHALKFKGWRSERVAQDFGDGSRILVVLPEDKLVQKKVLAIQSVVDLDLGFMELTERAKHLKQTYLYISTSKRVEGYCVAEAITSAFPVLTDNERSQTSGDRQKAWCCSNESLPAKCGISRIWVYADARRRGIATKLLDCVRYRFFLGVPLHKMDLAFTDPTPSGRAFAASYTETEKFLVYK